MQLSAYFTRSLGRGRREARPVNHQLNYISILERGRDPFVQADDIRKKLSPSLYALAATLDAMWADIFLILENGG
jgi:hypothetical protein